MASNGVVLFDDINFSPAIKAFWDSFNPSSDYFDIKGDKIDLSYLHTWSQVGFGAVVLRPS